MDEDGASAQPDRDLEAYLLALQSVPIAPRTPIVVSDLVMPPLTQFFNDPPASTALPPVQGGKSIGGGIANPTSDGFFGRKVAVGVATWEKNIAPVIPALAGKYDLSISGGVGTWTFDTVPNAPLMVDGLYAMRVATGAALWETVAGSTLPALPGTTGYYALHVKVDLTAEWVLLTTVDLPNCEDGTVVTYGALALPP